MNARIARNLCLKHVRAAKADFIKNELAIKRNDGKKFWQNINKILPDKLANANIRLNDSLTNIEIRAEDTPDYINNFFASIGPKLAEEFNEEWTYYGNNIEINMPNFEIQIEDIIKFCKEISVFKSSALQDMPTKFLKLAFLCTPDKIKKIVDLSISKGIVPLKWKHATIIPLRKEGNSKDVNNLRPVSLLPLPGKILEKIIQCKLSGYLEENNLLDVRQGGFRPKHSTCNTTVDFTEDIYRNMNNGEITVAVYIDLRKAFDTVNHVILLKKMKKMGISNVLLNWFKNYLTDRSQATWVNNLYSKSDKLLCGVPQGSVLGPTLFLIYVNDMSHILENGKHMLYADDTVLYEGGRDMTILEANLQQHLDYFAIWCRKNALTINVKKTKYVIYGTSNSLKRIRPLQLKMNGVQLMREQVYKYLGVYLDSTLNFNKHIDYVNKIITHKIFILSKIRRFIDKNTALHIFKSMIVPIIDYGNIIYAGGTETKLVKLKRSQNRGLRICLDVNGYISTVALHRLAVIPQIHVRVISNLKKYMFLQQNNDNYVVNRQINTRAHDATVYETCIPKIEKYKKGAIYCGIQVWNSLSVIERNTQNYAQYKECQKKWRMDVTMLAI